MNFKYFSSFFIGATPITCDLNLGRTQECQRISRGHLARSMGRAMARSVARSMGRAIVTAMEGLVASKDLLGGLGPLSGGPRNPKSRKLKRSIFLQSPYTN